MKTRFVNSQSGSVLIQAMMGLGFVGLISYSVMSYQSHSSSENKTQLAQNEIDSAAQVLSSLAAVPNLCNSNIFLRNNFVRPANIATQAAPDQELAVATGSPTIARAAWVDGVMGAQAATSVPGTITAFNLSIDRIAISGARFKRNTTSTNELWAGDIVVSAQKPNPGAPSVAGKRIIGTMELEINAAGQKVNCSTSTSVASICRDLGGVYDALGVPNCVFALQPMDCSSLGVDGYVHDVVGGAPVCQSARFVCPAGFFAAGITEGALDCIRLSRRIVYSTPPAPACTGGATTVVSSVPATPAGCYCSDTQTWDVGTSTCTTPITCTGGATTTVTANLAAPVGCYCPAGQSWDVVTSTCTTPITCTGGATTTVTTNLAAPVGCYCPAGQFWDAGTSTCTSGSGPGGTWITNLIGNSGIPIPAPTTTCTSIGATQGTSCPTLGEKCFVGTNPMSMPPFASSYFIRECSQPLATGLFAYHNSCNGNISTVQTVPSTLCSAGAIYCQYNDTGICVPPNVLTAPYTPSGSPFIGCSDFFGATSVTGSYTTSNGVEICTYAANSGLPCGNSSFKSVNDRFSIPFGYSIYDCVPCAAGSQPPVTCL